MIDREAWLAERQTYIGASEMAEAVGLSPWGDPISLWERKIGEAPEREASFRMRLGTLVEPVIGSLASEALGVKLRRVTGPIRHPAHPFIASNPDFRIVGSRGLVQAKLWLDGEGFGEPDETGAGLSIPLHYRVQGWGELLSTGLDFVYFAAMDPRRGVSLHLLDRRVGDNEAAIADLQADLVDFWRSYVEPRKMPPPSANSSEALARRFPHRAGKIGKVASAEQEQTLRELLSAIEHGKRWEAKAEELRNEVKSWIGDAAWIEGAGSRFSWGETNRKNVAWKEVAAAYRKLLDEATVDERNGTWDGKSYIVKIPPNVSLDAIESLYTEEKSYRGPFTIAKL